MNEKKIAETKSIPVSKQFMVYEKVRDIIARSKPHDFDRLSVKCLAKQLGVSRPYLSRVFIKCHRISLQEAILRQKMMWSYIALMEWGENKVEEVTEIMDYAQVPYFIRLFETYYGITPGRLQKCKRCRDSYTVWLRDAEKGNKTKKKKWPRCKTVCSAFLEG